MTIHFVSKPLLLGAILLTMTFIASTHAQQKVAANASATIRIDNLAFLPAEITIAPGTLLTWVNSDGIPHSVRAKNEAFRSRLLEPEQQFSFTFTAPGTYEYYCAEHPKMKGTVIVK